jgi:hypothetical protein
MALNSSCFVIADLSFYIFLKRIYRNNAPYAIGTLHKTHEKHWLSELFFQKRAKNATQNTRNTSIFPSPVFGKNNDDDRMIT